MKRPLKLSIKTLILSLFIFAILGTFIGSIGSLFSSMIVSKNTLEDNYLIENRYYAQKLATTTDALFINMFKSLTMETKKEIYLTSEPNAIQKELVQTLASTSFFNSIYYLDQTGHIIASAPEMGLAGTKISRIGAKEALDRKVPLISKPYVGVTKNLILLVSVPVFDHNGVYKGFIGGTIYLHEENSLKKVLGQHPKHGNNSYVFVVDSEGNIIYHPEKSRINDNVIENKVVQKALKGQSGYEETVNTRGISMLAGYASTSSSSKWGIVSQTPKDAVIKPAIDMAKQVSIIAIPFMIFVFLLSLFMLKKIVNPIRNLAI
ncbi:MAG TPA: cache domain-containing protein [Pseudoneobacillus sp.]|nr:cache domain-containing protein [Pseudoneobacillus sp.]